MLIIEKLSLAQLSVKLSIFRKLGGKLNYNGKFAKQSNNKCHSYFNRKTLHLIEKFAKLSQRNSTCIYQKTIYNRKVWWIRSVTDSWFSGKFLVAEWAWVTLVCNIELLLCGHCLKSVTCQSHCSSLSFGPFCVWFCCFLQQIFHNFYNRWEAKICNDWFCCVTS